MGLDWIADILSARPLSRSAAMSSYSYPSAAHIVGVHYRVGKKIGEGSFGVIFEGKFPTGLLFAFTAHLTTIHRYQPP